jgi:hypothetical protein
MTQGFNVAEQGHVVNILPPIDITGGVLSDRFTMENHSHATIVIQIGVSAAAATAIIVNECAAFTEPSPATKNAIAHSIYKEETAAGDTLGARTAVLAAGTTPSANDTIMYVIELDARELADGFPIVELEITNASANSVLCSAVAILSGSRYGNTLSATAIA